MKILSVITSLRTGGAERLVIDLTKRFRQAGEKAEILLFDGTRTPMVEEAEAAGIPVHSLGKGEGEMHDPFMFLRLGRFLKEHDYDIVHTHNTPCQMAAAIAPARSRLVTTEHNTSNRRRSWRCFLPVDRWMYGKYDSIVCVSKETETALINYLVKPALSTRISFIPNGIDLKRFSPESLPESKPDPRFCTILMVSAFRPEKDQLTLIRAISELPENFRLLLAGGAEIDEGRRMLEECRRAVTELGLERRVSFLGIRDDIPELIASSDILVLSTRHEGLSLSMLEGMASGKPFVASNVDGVREAVGDACILFEQGDYHELSGILSKLYYFCEFYEQTGRRCRALAGVFDIDVTACRYLSLYGSILNSNK